jgi:hypothetical protein
MRLGILGALLVLASTADCDDGASTTAAGGSSSSSSTHGSTSSSSVTSSSTGVDTHGDCSTDAECMGGSCIAFGSHKICTSAPKEATMCEMPGGGDECCTTADCAAKGGGACFAGQDLQFCGGAFPGFNRCVVDDCTTDAECKQNDPDSVCAPDGAFGLPKRHCVHATCFVDADCTAKPGGECLFVGDNPCCSHPSPDGLACVYPGDCVKDADCPNGACDIDPGTGESKCGPPNQGCPP